MKPVERTITPDPYTVVKIAITEDELRDLEHQIADALRFKGVVIEHARLVISGAFDQGNGGKGRGAINDFEFELPAGQRERADRLWQNGVQEEDA